MPKTPADQTKLDAELSAATEGAKAAAVVRTAAARQLADYMVGELAGVPVTPAETARQIALYRRAVDAHHAAHERYLASDLAWTLG